VISVPDSITDGPVLVGSNDVAQRIADQIGVTIAPTAVVTSEDEAIQRARELGWPLVMKIDLPAVAHRSDLGGVRIGIFGTPFSPSSSSAAGSIRMGRPGCWCSGWSRPESSSSSRLGSTKSSDRSSCSEAVAF
jgi:ATP-grasp domain